jgi:hypothetical protein
MTQTEALQAIIARIQGVWDHPALVAAGPLSSNATEDILRIAEEASAAVSSAKSDLQTLRTTIADQAFDAYDFGDDKVEDSNGWQHDGGDDFKKTIFLESKTNEDSEKATFVVEFIEDAAVVETAYVEYR